MIISFTAFVNKKKKTFGLFVKYLASKATAGHRTAGNKKMGVFLTVKAQRTFNKILKKKDLGKNSRRLRNVVSLVFKRFLDAGKKRKMKWNKRCKKEHRKKNSSVKKRNGRWFGWIFPVCFYRLFNVKASLMNPENSV